MVFVALEMLERGSLVRDVPSLVDSFVNPGGKRHIHANHTKVLIDVSIDVLLATGNLPQIKRTNTPIWGTTN